MAGVTAQPSIRGQFAAIALLRWRLFVNGTRNIRGRLEIISRIFMGIGFTGLAFGGAIGLGFAGWFVVSHNQIELVALFLWGIFAFWQLFPVMAHALSENIDSSYLLRFPLTYRAYFWIRMAYGSLEPATLIGLLWVAGLAIGVAFGSFVMFWWAVPVLALFVVFNILFARMVFAWIERWLAQRKTREIMGLIFFVLIIGMQFIGPAIGYFTRSHSPQLGQYTAVALPFERVMPPGLAAGALTSASVGAIPVAFVKFALLGVYAAVSFWLLNLRLRAYYFGEDLSESAARVAKPAVKENVSAGWSVPLASDATSAVFQKEIRYILRSGPMLYTLVMPVVILVIFKFSVGRTPRGGGSFLARSGEMAFPIGAAYAVLILSNLVYNSFGADGVGIQFFFLSPARFSEILLGKNLAHATVLAIEVVLVFLGASFLYEPPSPVLFFATIFGVAFGLLVNLIAGNLLSIFTPKKIDVGAFGRQRASTVTAFATLGVQALTIGLATATVLIARSMQMLWVAIPVFVLLAVVAGVAYALVLGRVDGMAIGQREALIEALSKTS